VVYFPDKTGRQELSDFLAYDSDMRDGVYVATGNVKGYAYTDIVTGQGEGQSSTPLVKVFTNSAAMHSTSLFMTMIDSFLAGDASFHGGARVTSLHDSTGLPGYGSNRDDIVVASATGDGTAGTIFARDLLPGSRSAPCNDPHCCTCCVNGACGDHAHDHAIDLTAQPQPKDVVAAAAPMKSAFSSMKLERIATSVVLEL